MSFKYTFMMITTPKILFFLFLAASIYTLEAQTIGREESAKNTVLTLLQLSENEKFEEAAYYIAYKGNEKERVDNDTYNYKVSDEAKKVRRICKKINALLNISDSHEFGNFYTRKRSGKINYVFDLFFISGEQKIRVEFSFIDFNNRLILIDLD